MHRAPRRAEKSAVAELRWRSGARVVALALTLGVQAALSPRAARADDLAAVVARAREQVEHGDYTGASRTLAQLPDAGLPSALAVEAALLDVTASLVTNGVDAGRAACANAVRASDYDPEVARDQSPKVRDVCRRAATEERTKRLELEGVQLTALSVEAPAVAWQPVRISATASAMPPWLRVVARVSSSALDGAFDVALVPSLEGPLRGTLDPSWIRPRATIRVEIVAQDRFGDLKPTGKSATVEVPSAEAMVVLGEVPASAKVSVDGVVAHVGPRGSIPVAPGPHSVAMELDDGAFASATVDVARGGESRVALSPQQAARAKGLAWLATGTAVALGATGGVLLISADRGRREIEELSARREQGTGLPAVEYSEIASKDADRRLFATLGTASLIAGGVAGAIAITFWAWPDRSPNKGRATVSLRAELWRPGGSLSGAF